MTNTVLTDEQIPLTGVLPQVQMQVLTIRDLMADCLDWTAKRESSRSPAGVQQESSRSPAGVKQESSRSPAGVQQESSRSPAGV